MDYTYPYDQLGAASPGDWQNANPSAGQRGSIVNAAVFPAVQNELLNVIKAAGITPDSSTVLQLLQAIRSGSLSAYADQGTADALLVKPATAYTALALGTPINVLKIAAANATTAPTLTVGAFSKPIIREDGTAVAVGDLPAGALLSFRYDGLASFRCVGLRKSDFVTAIAGSTTVVTNILAQASIGKGFFSDSVAGTRTFTVPAGIYWLKMTAVGAGGGAPGGPAQGNTTQSSTWASGGGGGGGTASGWFEVAPGEVITYTIGAGGAASAYGSTASAGGTTSIGTFLQATGGGGGQSSPSGCQGGNPGVGSGGQENLLGAVGGDGNNIIGYTQGGAGGASSLGGGGRTCAGVDTVQNASVPGAGGGGGWGFGGANGGIGAAGYVSFEY